MKKLLYLSITLFLIGCTVIIKNPDDPNDSEKKLAFVVGNPDKTKKVEKENSEKEKIKKYFDVEYIYRGFLDGIIKDKNTGNLYFVKRGSYGISINPILKEDGKPLNIKDYEK